ncbi:MAG: aminopeptidase P family protein [Actinobacteria bacterium]|nr:aminopeptidase P family protein [Actinomycetota bacterium]
MSVISATSQSALYASRLNRVRDEMQRQAIDATLLSVGHDLPYLTGYCAMPLERLTMLVVTHDAPATLIVPRLEAPRVTAHDEVFKIVAWGETENPVEIVAKHLGRAKKIAIGDQMWARFLVELMGFVSGASFARAVDVVGAMRMIKDAAEIAALQAAGAAADRVASQLQRGEIALRGRTEAQVSADISARLIAEGHDAVNFAIVAAGENAASPHHHAGPRVIQNNEILLCDFGGTMNGYCSDITRCVFLGEPSRKIMSAYSVLRAAHSAGVKAGVVGATCESVDAAARAVIDDAGFGDFFIHRTGHGIGMEAHEEPYMVSGNKLPIKAGHAFSVEPGIYLPGKWGMRLEDIVVATEAGPLSMTHVDHSLVILS